MKALLRSENLAEQKLSSNVFVNGDVGADSMHKYSIIIF